MGLVTHRQAEPLPPMAGVWATCPELRLERWLESSVCSGSTDSCPGVAELCGTPALGLHLLT